MSDQPSWACAFVNIYCVFFLILREEFFLLRLAGGFLELELEVEVVVELEVELAGVFLELEEELIVDVREDV